MKKIKLAYFGSPNFAADFLEKILLDKDLPVEVKLVITQPDSPVGRKQLMTPTPVKITSKKFGIPVFENLDFRLLNSKLKKIDLSLLYAYGTIIPKEFLSLPDYGFWNIHPSLLPKYRGPSPIASSLINGDELTGVTIIKMDEEIDHGPIIAQESLTIDQDDKRPDLEKKLTDLGFGMFKKTIIQLTSSRVNELKNSQNFLNLLNIKSQNHSKASYTKKLTKQNGFIEYEKIKKILQPTTYNLQPIYNLFRGLYPWPGLWTKIQPIQLRQLDEAKRLKITDLELVNEKLIIKKVQLEGKKEVDFKTFNKAYNIF